VLQNLQDEAGLELSADISDRGRPIVIATSVHDKVDCFFTRGMSTSAGIHIDFAAVHSRSVVLTGPLPPSIRVPCVDDRIALKQLRTTPKAADLEDIAHPSSKHGASGFWTTWPPLASPSPLRSAAEL
jgi:hypothetical protein